MKINNFLLFILLIVIVSLGVVYATDVTVGNYTFTAPDGYTIVKSDDTCIEMRNNTKNALSFTTGIDGDIESSKQGFIKRGYTIINEKSFEYNGHNGDLIVFSIKDNETTSFSYKYIVLSNDGNFVITVITDNSNFNGDLNSNDNPVTEIFDTLQVKN